MARFAFRPTPLDGVTVVERAPIGDERGFLERIWCAEEWAPVFGSRSVAQINHTRTGSVGTVRGLHYQVPPFAETKYISCLNGAILDVAVDIRRGSPTFLQWHAEELTADNFRSLVVPEGFAHGFQALTDDCTVLYVNTAPHDASSERGINPLDPALAIEWQLPPANLSERDGERPLLAPDFVGLDVGELA
ncbi:MAG: dTDP-4-dehydrorhamnose 3,5-epimerase family protein [Aeromicrobium sp.]